MNLILTLAILLPQQSDRSAIPLEAEPADPAAAKIVILAGGFSKGKGEHEYFAGSVVLSRLLAQTKGVAPVLAAEGWPRNEKILDGAKAVVFYMDGGGKQPVAKPEKMERLAKLAAAGAGIVHLHQIIDYPKAEGEAVLPLIGGVWVPKHSGRGHWDMTFKDFVEHPSTRGVAPFTENDGFLYKLKFVEGMKGITPLLRTSPPKQTLQGSDDVVAWAYERPAGGRSFVFTGGHGHKEWGLEGLRRFVVNGILWSAGLEVPAGGAPVELDPADLTKWMDPVPPKK